MSKQEVRLRSASRTAALGGLSNHGRTTWMVNPPGIVELPSWACMVDPKCMVDPACTVDPPCMMDPADMMDLACMIDPACMVDLANMSLKLA